MDDESLIELAKKARAHAYVPYSGFAVGAAALAGKRRVVTKEELLPFAFTMKPQEVKPKAQTDWLGFCKA